MIPTVVFYLLAIIPFIYGGIAFALNRRIHWMEWIGNGVLCFAMAGLFHLIGVNGLTADVETWSGQITTARQYSAWHEYYEEAIYRTEFYTTTESYTDSKGNTSYRTVINSRQVFDHWESRRRWHSEHFGAESNIDTSYSIDKSKYFFLCNKFGRVDTVAGRRYTSEHNSRMIEGDPNDYVAVNINKWIEPVTKLVSFENKIKATPSVFSFAPVPKDIKVYPYPPNDNHFISDRLVGSALATIDQLKFDQMNAVLGPIKRVNVIMVGMGAVDSMMGEWQRSAWIGGKKNDVVIVWGGNNKHPDWVKVFGWTDSEVCKRNLETIILDNGATTEVLPLIEKEIREGYVKKEWKKSFAHITVPAPAWAVWWYLGVMVFTQAGIWFWFNVNEIDKGTKF